MAGSRRRMAISFSADSSEILMPSTFVGIGGDDVEADIHGRVVVDTAPIALQGRIEHFAQPVHDHRLLHLAQDVAIDPGVVVG